jgi:hypothetical protein
VVSMAVVAVTDVVVMIGKADGDDNGNAGDR